MNGGKALGGLRTLLACLLIGALYSVHKGQDASWDLKNYHLYNPWALLHGRLTIDLAAASLQTYFNPLLDLPYYLLGIGPLRHAPRVLAGLQGLWFGGLVFVVLQIARRLAQQQERRFGLADLCAVLVGITGTMVLSQVGLSSNEMPLALCVIGALYLLLPKNGAGDMPPFRNILLAGCLCGLAAGLKPTAVVYPPALAIALFMAPGVRAPAWRQVVLFALATAVGFLLAYGWWGWTLYRLTGNPIFPLFNQVFHSAWVPPASITDVRFLPRNLGQWLLYPLYWVQPNQGLVTEDRFADPRYALAMLALCVMAVTGYLRRATPFSGRPAARLVAVFVAVSYVAWLVLFSILRYAIPIEVLSGLLVLLAWQALSPNPVRPGTVRRWGMLVLLVGVAGLSRVPNWGHTQYASEVFDIHPPTIEPGSLVVVVGQPQAYLIPFFAQPQASRFVGISWLSVQSAPYVLGEQLQQRLHDQAGPIYVLLRDDAGADLDVLMRWLPGHRIGSCRAVPSALEHTRGGADISAGLRLCSVARNDQ